MWDDAGALGRLTRWLLLLMVLMLLGAGVAWIYNSPYFPVKQVSIQGKLLHTDGKQLQAIAHEYGLVDMQGNVFPAKIPDNLPVFEGQEGTGKDMVQRYREFTDILEPQGLKIGKLIYTPRSAWSIELDNGITIRLGRENEIFRLQRFAGIWPSLLKKHENRLAYVDMRYKDGFAVRYSKPLDEPSEKEVQEQTSN